MSLNQIAVELGITKTAVLKLIRKHGWWMGANPRPSKAGITYDAAFIETLRAFKGQPHRESERPDADWLARYQQERKR